MPLEPEIAKLRASATLRLIDVAQGLLAYARQNPERYLDCIIGEADRVLGVDIQGKRVTVQIRARHFEELA